MSGLTDSGYMAGHIQNGGFSRQGDGLVPDTGSLRGGKKGKADSEKVFPERFSPFGDVFFRLMPIGRGRGIFSGLQNDVFLAGKGCKNVWGELH